MLCTDTLTVDTVKRTREGYLVADARAARVGIQEYAGREVDPDGSLGLRDRATVRVWRSEDEVFHKDAIASFSTIAVTNDHPPEAVTSDNWRKYGVGETGDEILRDGKFMRVPLAIRDAAAVRDYEAGKRELSCGYTCDVVAQSGTTADGEAYDAIQTNIRGNHVAIVQRGRAGPEVRIGDSTPMKTILIDGHSVEVSDAAEIAVANLKKQLTDAQTVIAGHATADAEMATKLSTADAKVATLEAKVATLEAGQLTGDALDAVVAERGQLIADAKRIGGENLDVKGSNADIKKRAVLAKLGDTYAGKDAGFFDAAFTLQVDALAKDGTRQLADALSHIKPAPQLADAATKAHQDRNNALREGWKTPAGNA